ncbi:MAG: FAD-dependent oxidoreductase [Chitinophagaceae bacterium]|nr:MAG: FAD-dependent oxidoreductase [Chitinophagaceae bacterium]
MYDVLILGAGASGLYAARTIARAGLRVAVVEARDRVGGRVWTIPGELGPVELGAEFIHGKGALTKKLAQDARIAYGTMDGNMYAVRNGVLAEQDGFIERWDELQQQLESVREDIPVRQFIDEKLAGNDWSRTRAQLIRYVEGYYAADIDYASTRALKRELSTGAHEEDERTPGGYGPLLEFLCRDAEGAGAHFFLQQVISVVRWRENEVELTALDGEIFRGKKLLCTLPLGCWQQRTVEWIPALPEKEAAAQQLGLGAALKVILGFHQPFWEEAAPGLGFLFSEAPIPTWWAGSNPNTLVGWVGGPTASGAIALSEAALLEYAFQSLATIFQMPDQSVRAQLRAFHFHDWCADPFARGAYSFEVVAGKERQQRMAQSVKGTLFFAGECLESGPSIGTVEAAFATAKAAVDELLAGV